MGVVGRLNQYASMQAAEFDDYSMSENLVTDAATDYNYSFNNQIVATTTDVAPDGMTVLCKHNLTGATSPFLNCRANTTLSSGNTYTMSMWLKGTTSFSASFAFVGETTSEIYSNTANVTTTWQRFTLTFTLIATQTLSRLQLFFATQGEGKIVSVWGAQLERGSVATDYTSRKSGTQVIRVLPSTTNTNITGLGTYYSSGFDENVGFTTFLPANISPPYDPVYDEFGGTLFGAGQGRYMRQYNDKSVIVYNEIDEITDLFGRGIVRDGLVLDLDAGISASYAGIGTTWTDLSVYGNNGTLTNGPTYSSSNGGSIVFDGSDDYTNHPPVLSSGQQRYTISAWWRTSVNNRIQVVWEQNSSTATSNTRAALIFINANWGFNGQNNDAHDKVPVRVNQWTNGVITIDTTLGTNPVKIYENGSLYWEGNTGGSASNLNVGNFASGLGRKISTNSEYFIGNIAQVSIYNRALTASEVSQNYNALKHRFGL